MEIIDLDNKQYAIDMNKLMAWVSKTPANEKNVTTSISQLWPIVEDGNDETMQKEVTETKSTLNENMNNVRYDFVRILINTILNPLFNGDGMLINSSINDFTFGQSLAFNTLLKEGIIIELND